MMTMRKIKNNSRMFSQCEKDWLIDILDAYAKTPEGHWLNSVLYATSVEYFWCDCMEAGNGILCARPLFGNEIFLASNPGATYPEVIKHWIECIAPTAIHELRHLYQQKVYGKLLWAILRLPEVLPCFYGKLLIEKDALAIEEQADNVILAEKHLSLFAD